MQQYKYLIFDLDGTLLDTVPLLLYNLNLTFKSLNLTGDFSISEMMSFIGSGKEEQINRALRARNYDIATHFAAVNELLTYHYDRNVTSNTTPFPEVNKTLEVLKAHKCKLYIATNKPEHIARPIVTHFFGETFIDVRGDLGDGLIKPQPEFLSAFIVKHNINALETLYIGDSTVDYLTAKNAGIPFVLVSHGYDKPLLQSVPENVMLITNFSEIIKIAGFTSQAGE